MPDWRRLVSRRLGPLAVAPERRDEIVREVAGFLEDHYEERLRLGQSPRAALREALASGGPLSDLVRELERVEVPMRRRLKTLWLPGLGISLAAMGLLFAVARTGAGVQIVWHPPQAPLLFYWPWLAALPLLGAAGAAWSERAGGGGLERLLVALFPALGFLGLFLVAVPVAMVVDAHVSMNVKLPAMLIGVLNWVVLPAVALLLGSLPVLHRSDTAAARV